MRKAIVIALCAFCSTVNASNYGFGDNKCLQGVQAAYEAYSMSVMDAKYPDVQKATFALSFRLSQQPFPVNEVHAYRSLNYIIKRLRDADIRFPQDYEIAAATSEYINKECMK